MAAPAAASPAAEQTQTRQLTLQGQLHRAQYRGSPQG